MRVDFVEFFSIGYSVFADDLFELPGSGFVFRTVTVGCPTDNTDNSSYSVHELHPFHDNTLVISCLDDVAFLGNGSGCQNVVTSDHPDLDASLPAV